MRKALHILGTLEDADVDWMARQGEVQHILAGSVLIEELKPIDHLYIVLDGEFAVRIGGVKGTEVARLLSGEVLGEISFVDTRPPSASVIAIQGSYVLALRRDMLTAKLERDGPFAARFYHAIAKFLADRLSMTTGRLGYGNPQQDADVDQIDDEAMEGVSMAAIRFDQLLRQLRGDYRARSAGVN